MSIQSVRELVAAWAEANLAFPQVCKNFLDSATKALEKNIDCNFAIGEELTQRKKGYYVALYAQQFFAFALSRPQAQNLCAGPNRLTYSECPPPMLGSPIAPQLSFEPYFPNVPRLHVATSLPGATPLSSAEPLPIEIHRLEIDNCRRMGRLLPIQGKVHYELDRKFTGPIAASLDYGMRGPNRKIGYFHPTLPLSSPGVMTFSFPAITNVDEPDAFVEQKTHAMFFRFVTSLSGESHDWATPISNPLGVLVDVA